MNITPLDKNILFVFSEGTQDGMFVPSTKSGIIMTNQDASHNHTPKWGKVIKKGPNVSEDIVVGQYVLIEPLQWTLGTKFEGVQMWKTDESKIIAMSTEIIPAY